MKKKWIERQQAILAAARAAGRGLTAEEQAELDDLQRKIDDPNEGGEAESNGLEPAGGQRSVSGQEPANNPAPTAAPAVVAGTEDAQRAVAEERQRINDILALCRQTGMDPEEHIHSGATVDRLPQLH